ncbi:unnamed protein product [Lasius platythorax]|uniref:Uncharacterized protein n=1 Tax=Lasius platythorax TaxID=488582 RepID=A0AAV2NZ42_9HYME
MRLLFGSFSNRLGSAVYYPHIRHTAYVYANYYTLIYVTDFGLPTLSVTITKIFALRLYVLYMSYGTPQRTRGRICAMTCVVPVHEHGAVHGIVRQSVSDIPIGCHCKKLVEP